MPCVTPLKAYRGEGGRIVFDSKSGWSDRPIELACGQCIQCRIKRSREWALRCVHEASMHPMSEFLTLTYRDQELPENMSLEVKDWQLFAKRARKKLGPFRFYAVGEYGELGRPHFHAIAFGMDLKDRVKWKKSDSGEWAYRSPMLESLWTKGHCTTGYVNYKSAAYVSRYVMKKQTGKAAKEYYGDRRPEFSVMSRRPGVGAGWFEKYGSEVFPSDEVVYEGRLHQAPKYYLERLEDDLKTLVKSNRLQAASRRAADRTPERLKAIEKCSEARLSLLTRSL